MISSQLQSQLFPKTATWELLQNRELVWKASAIRISQLRVYVWSTCVYVYLPKGDDERDCPQGVSVFLSMWEYLDWFMGRSHFKAYNLSVFKARKNLYTVSSFQGQTTDPYTVTLNIRGARCHCMLFRCLGNRVKNECPYFYQLIKQSRFFAGQVVCHHICAALNKAGFGCLQDYLESLRAFER